MFVTLNKLFSALSSKRNSVCRFFHSHLIPFVSYYYCDILESTQVLCLCVQLLTIEKCLSPSTPESFSLGSTSQSSDAKESTEPSVKLPVATNNAPSIASTSEVSPIAAAGASFSQISISEQLTFGEGQDEQNADAFGQNEFNAQGSTVTTQAASSSAPPASSGDVAENDKMDDIAFDKGAAQTSAATTKSASDAVSSSSSATTGSTKMSDVPSQLASAASTSTSSQSTSSISSPNLGNESSLFHDKDKAKGVDASAAASTIAAQGKPSNDSGPISQTSTLIPATRSALLPYYVIRDRGFLHKLFKTNSAYVLS